jgi:predicted flavoprotein YhiN
MKRLMKGFSQEDAYNWFERHGIRLTTQEDQCVFPMSQDSHTIINCFLAEAQRHSVVIRTETRIDSLDQLSDYGFIAVTTGGMTTQNTLMTQMISIALPVPSLFTFRIDDERLHALM